MGWLSRLLGATAPAAAPLSPALAAEEAIRAGFDAEARGDPAAAHQQYLRALECAPDGAEPHYQLGRLAAADRRMEEAVAHLQQAAEREPREATMHATLGDALVDARRYAEALEAFAAARALLPECAALRNNHAVCLIETGRRDEALVELEAMRADVAPIPELVFNLAGIYHEYGRTAEAIAAFQHRLRLTPRHEQTFDNLLLELNYSAGHGADEVFEWHRRYGETFARGYTLPRPDPAWPRRLRVGYVSPDFRAHSVAYFIEPILAHHDRDRFEVYCYHVHPRRDGVTARLRALADHWRDADELAPDALAAQVARDRIDILVDLAGHTADNRMQTFALKPAPVQATYLGYPGTSGLGAIDWHITDARADPPGEAERHNVERLALLPATYFCYRPPADAPAVAPLPAGDSGPVTFGSFNHFPKLSAPFLDAVARVLGAIPGSRLILKSRPLSNPSLARRVRERFDAAGIEASRVELRGWEPGVSDHLAIYGQVDIALDSFPYNGATTSCEALWMGVPVVTLAGDRHAGRMGASLLHAIGLEELVTRDEAQYVATAVALAGDRVRLGALRAGLRGRMRGSPLMDEPRFARDLEALYERMWRERLQPSPASADATQLEALFARSRALAEAHRPGEAMALAREVLQADPAHAGALTLLWNLALDLETPGAAADALARAIERRGDVARFHHMLGCVLQAQGQIEDAIAAFQRALALDPGFAGAHNNLGCLLEAAGDLAGATAAYRAATVADARLAQARYNLGNACRQAGALEEAADHIGAALALDPSQAEWHCNLGDLQAVRLRFDAAVESYRRAVQADRGLVRAHAALGEVLQILGRREEAEASLRAALGIRPEAVHESALLAAAVTGGDRPPAELLERHRDWARRHASPLARVTRHPARPRTGPRRLNVGYVSPDFVEHPVAALLEPVLGAHDRAAVQVFGYSNAGLEDARTLRLRARCDHWREVAGLPDVDLAERIRADGIDVLVDLAGHAPGGRPCLFARKPAPVQFSWLGYPGPTGIAAMDCRITDAIVDPEGEADAHYDERLVRLPGFVCLAPEGIGAPPSPGESQGITFACADALRRAGPAAYEAWAALLARVPGSRLRCWDPGFAAASASEVVLRMFAARGIAAARLDLVAPTPDDTRAAAWHGADLALDSFPGSGLAATCDALRQGLPVVTLAGAGAAGRLGASLLERAGLGELVARSPQAYVELAAALAGEGARLATLRRDLPQRLRASPLCDVEAFTRGLEAAFQEAWARWARS